MQKTYASLGRLSYASSIFLIRAWMKTRRSRRARVMVFDKKGRLLLVRNWFGPQTWSLPGGGCKYLEADQTAAVRELYEETGLKIKSTKLQFIYEYKHPKLSYQASVFAAYLQKIIKPTPVGRLSKLEIIGCAWFDLTKLPEVSPQVKQALEQLRRQAK